ncbi:MAG TPA: hypothetical protein VF337_04985 [Candidatus Limnocylindrales bacterium]
MMLLVPLSWAVVIALATVGLRSVIVEGHAGGDTAGGWWLSVLIAVLLAAVLLPLVALSLTVFDTSHAFQVDGPSLPFADSRRWTSTVPAVLMSALVAGAIGTPVVRRRAVAGAALTFCMALIVAIAVFPVVPALLGERTGMVGFCLDGCTAVVDSADPSSGARAAVFFAFTPWVAPVAVAALAVGVGCWTVLVRLLNGRGEAVG